MFLVGFIIRVYRDARPPENQIQKLVKCGLIYVYSSLCNLTFTYVIYNKNTVTIPHLPAYLLTYSMEQIPS